MPTAAFAANECGDPSANAATADTFQCTGSFASITYPATNGNLTLQLLNDVTTTTGGLVVAATGANTVTVNRIADTTSGDPSLTSTSGAGVQVTRATGSGAITVTLSDNDEADTPLVISGTTAGVLLQNAGTAATNFTTTNGTISASAGAGIDLSTLSLAAGNLNVTNGSAVTGSTYGVRASTPGTGSISITNNGSITGASGAILVAAGNAVTINNRPAAALTGAVTLNNTGATTFTNGGTWVFTGTTSLGSGAATLTNSPSLSSTGTAPSMPAGIIWVSNDGVATTLDFGGGADTFTNQGVLAVGGGTEAAATLTLTGLETWNSAGNVLFGANADATASDGSANDRIVSTGTVFNGTTSSTDASTLLMDVDFAADQDDCSAAITADCLDLRGSSTTGSTSIVVSNVGHPLAAAERIVLVDVAGAGTSGAGHFALSAESSGYRLVGATPTLETGLFFYTLDYDAAARQHALTASAFNGRSLELARVGRAASEPWRTATGLWETRQVDLRDTLAGEAGGGPGVWLKVAGNFINENRRETLELAAGDVAYSTSARQHTTALVGGVDLVRGSGEGGTWVFGVTAGKLSSTLEYRAGASEVELDGHSLGAYATMVAGPLFIDAIVNTTDLDVTHSGLGRDIEGSASSLGYQVEGGYRLLEVNGGGIHVEPLAAVTYVRTEVDNLDFGSVDADFGEATSLRAALGARVGGAMVMQALTTRLSFTGRIWRELDGDNETTLSAAFGDAAFTDPGLDTLGDVGVSLGLFTPGGRVSANFGYNLTFGEDYQSSDVNLGVRVRW